MLARSRDVYTVLLGLERIFFLHKASIHIILKYEANDPDPLFLKVYFPPPKYIMPLRE